MHLPRWKDLVAFRNRDARNSKNTSASEMMPIENMLYDVSSSTISSVRTRRSTLIGAPPSIVNTERKRNSCVQQSPGFIYNEEICREAYYRCAEDIPTLEENHCLWIDVPGVYDHQLISGLSQRFGIHPLVEADIETTEQRTKLDVFEDAIFLVCKMIYPDSVQRITHVEQISFYLKKNILITFRETSRGMFDQVKNRIRQNRGRIRKSKIDYLFYSLIDTIVDRYMDVLDRIGTSLESIDHQLMKNLSRDTLESIYDIKREMLFFRRTIVPLKEIIIKLQKEEETQIMQESTNIYLKDLFDHVVQVNDTIDTYREMLASFIDLYMMLNTNGMNQVMKTLTIISTIFIPLTFVVGVYGMNFDNMPELRWRYGYFVVLGFMGALAIIMLSYFKRKKWF